MKTGWSATFGAGLALLLAAPAAQATAAEPHYGEVRNYPGAGTPFGSGFSSSSVTSGDLDGDGHADLAVADFTSAVSVLRGDGLGGFAPAVSYPTGAGSSAVVTGDLDGAGPADLAVANAGAGTVSVLLSRDGSLVHSGDYPVGFSVLDVAAADVDADGRPDLVAAVPLMRQVVVLRNTGDGRFEQAATIDVSEGPAGVAPADLNSDGNTDLVVALDGAVTSLPGGVARVQALLGRGDGTFTAGRSTGGIGFLESITVADVNGDGYDDALGADIWTGAVSTLLGTGDGGFGAPIASPTGSGTTDVAVADADGDGRPDVVAGHGEDEVSVLVGSGDGKFRLTETHALEAGASNPFGGPQSVLFEDLDGNAAPDIAVAGGTPNVSVLLHTEDAS